MLLSIKSHRRIIVLFPPVSSQIVFEIQKNTYFPTNAKKEFLHRNIILD